MTNEQIEQAAFNAHRYGVAMQDIAVSAYIAGAHSRDEEITRLSAEIEDDNFVISKLREELDQLRNPWISVEDRLPEKHVDVIVDVSGGFRLAHIGDDNEWYCYDTREPNGSEFYKYIGGEPTHWMPIPKIPKGGQQ